MANEFSFVLESFRITDTRSLHKDTDYVSFTLVVNPQNGSGTPRTQRKSMGDLNNGTFPVNLSFTNITVNPTDTVVLNYLIVNTGSKNPGEIENALESAASKLLGEAGKLLPIPFLDSALEKVGSWLSGEIVGVLNTLCDGPVAVEQATFTYADLIARTANGPFNQSTKHPGIDSAHGCGRNSVYFVNWQMVELGNPANKVVPDVIDQPVAAATKLVQQAGLVAKFTGNNQTHSVVVTQHPPASQIVDPGSTVTMALGNAR